MSICLYCIRPVNEHNNADSAYVITTYLAVILGVCDSSVKQVDILAAFV